MNFAHAIDKNKKTHTYCYKQYLWVFHDKPPKEVVLVCRN